MATATTTYDELYGSSEHFLGDDYEGEHTILIGYLLWLIGFTGAHRFYYGKPVSGAIWFCTFGLLGIGWIVDAFLIPAMDAEAYERFESGPVDYNVAWGCLLLAGPLGLHRFLQRKWISGLVYLFTAGLLGLGVLVDIFTLNTQIDEVNRGYLVPS